MIQGSTCKIACVHFLKHRDITKILRIQPTRVIIFLQFNNQSKQNKTKQKQQQRK